MSGSFGPSIYTVTIPALIGISHSSGTISLTTGTPSSSFADFAVSRGSRLDPYRTWIVQNTIDISASTNWVRLSIAATAPVSYVPNSSDPLQRATYAGISAAETNMKASGSAYLDHAQFENAPSTTLLTQSAEGYDTALYYSLEPGVGALWERSQARTLNGRWAGHFIQSPAYSGNSYQRVSAFSSYNQLLAANRTYSDVLNGPS